MKRVSDLGRLLNCNGEPASDSLIMRANAVNGLDAMTDLLYGPGQHMAGSDMSNEDAMTYARNSFPFGNYCIVRDWIWIDLDVTDEQRKSFAAGLTPQRTRKDVAIFFGDGHTFLQAKKSPRLAGFIFKLKIRILLVQHMPEVLLI